MATDPEANENAPLPPFSPFPQPKPPEEPMLLPALQVETPSRPGMPPEIADLKKFASRVLAQNAASLQNSSQYLRFSYVLLLLMYCALSDMYATAIGKYAPLSGAASTPTSAATTTERSATEKGAGTGPAS